SSTMPARRSSGPATASGRIARPEPPRRSPAAGVPSSSEAGASNGDRAISYPHRLMSDVEARLDRLESIHAIRELAVRYAIALDARDLDTLVGLFADDVKASPDAERGRGPLQAHYENLLRPWGYTVHQVFQQAIDFESSDRAMGKVYCKAEHDM